MTAHSLVPVNSAQSAPVRPKGAFGGPPKHKPGTRWQDKVLLAARAITELDPEYRGSFQAERDRIDGRHKQAEREAYFENAIQGYSPEQQQALRAMPMEQAMTMLSDRMLPSRADERADTALAMQQKQIATGNERWKETNTYNRQRDEVGDQRWDKTFEAGRSDRAEDVDWRQDRAEVQDGQWEQGFGLQQKVAAEKAGENQTKQATAEGQLRREFLGQNKPFQEVQRAYERVRAVDTTNAAGQMGLIFQYMKMLDPGSTVREGEFATAQNTTGIPGQVINAYNKAAQGEFLNPTQVVDFRAQADNLYAAAEQGFERSFEDYRARADSYQYDAQRTVPDLRNPQSAPAKITGDGDYEQLPSGAIYVGPDGVKRRKP